MQIKPLTRETPPYTALAAGYDLVMAHVDYEGWADYAHGLLQTRQPAPETILELGCGTGSLALALQPLGDYRYTATDASAEMIRVARRKAELEDLPIRFEVADFAGFGEVAEAPADAVVLLYDGLNYLLEEADVRALLDAAFAALRPGGVFLFDQSTPANSINNDAFFEDQGAADGFAYVRRSRYDADVQLHTTTFELTVGGARFHEEHRQRAYALGEIRALIAETGFEEVGAYEDFTTAPATEASERVHWLLAKP